MALPAPANLQFYVGIGGQQSGPYSQVDLLKKIQAGEVPRDALVWYDGLSDWQPIDAIDYLKGAGASTKQAAAPAPAPEAAATPVLAAFKPLDSGAMPVSPAAASVNPVVNLSVAKAASGATLAGQSTFAAPGEDFQPVIPNDGSYNEVAPPDWKTPKNMAIAGAGAAVVVVMLAYFLFSGDSPISLPTGDSASQKKGPAVPTTREGIARDALSKLLLEPETALASLTKIVSENAGDPIGKESMQAVVEYYRQRQRPGDAGRFLMGVKQPLEASKLFMMDPSSYPDAESALFTAYQDAKGSTNTDQKRSLLVEDIKLLLGPLKNEALAIERIQLFEKTFPGQPHPYGYYLKTPEQKITDIFQRISFHFVQTLLAYVTSEFPQVSLVNRPFIEVKRDKQGKYRIVGSYKGDVVLNQDRMNAIRFVFWMFAEQWTVVETNLTSERAKFSKSQKEKHDSEVLSAPQMLDYLETVFRTQYPKNSLHEATNSLVVKEGPKNTVD